jgi:hypothetical protein
MDQSSAADRTPSLRNGARAGALATFVMSAFRMPVSRSPPPPSWFWAEFVAGGSPDDHPYVGAVLHLLYGVAAGVVYALLAPAGGRDDAAVPEWAGAVRGVVYGAVLSGVGIVALMDWLLGLDLDADERFVFHVSHLVYGVTLGTWLGSGD